MPDVLEPNYKINEVPHLVPQRVFAVAREPQGRKYVVLELDANGNWPAVTRGYDHITSAYAAMAKMQQKDLKERGITPPWLT